jgi:hypothetical protein
VVGGEPPGFTTEVPYLRAADPVELLEVQVHVSGDRHAMRVPFHVRDLREGEVLYGSGLVSYDEFMTATERDCNASADLGRSLASVLFFGSVVTAAMFGVLLVLISLVRRLWRREAERHR